SLRTSPGHGLLCALNEPPVAVDRQTVPVLLLAGRPENREPAYPGRRPQSKELATVPRGEIATPSLGEPGKLTPAHLQPQPGPPPGGGGPPGRGVRPAPAVRPPAGGARPPPHCVTRPPVC